MTTSQSNHSDPFPNIFYWPATLLLAPLLWLQGIYARKVTPILPEPMGERTGNCGTGNDIGLLVVGDSAAAGVGVEMQQDALTVQLAAALASTHRVHWKLLAQTGDSSRDVLARLQDAPAESFDIALVSVGVNDVTQGTSLRTWVANLQMLVHALQERFGVQRIVFLALPPMHLFPALPQPLRWWLGTRALQFNAELTDFANRTDRCLRLDWNMSFEMEFMATDGFHPGKPAYAVLAELAASSIREGSGLPCA